MSDLNLTCINLINFLNLNVSIHILQTFDTFPFVLATRISLTINTLVSLVYLFLFSLCLIELCCYKE